MFAGIVKEKLIKNAENVQLKKKSDLKFRYFMNFQKHIVGREK